MPNDYIKIDASVSTHAAGLKTFVTTLRSAYEQGTKIKAVMDHNCEGMDFKNLETLFGLPDGSGKAVYAMLSGAIVTFEGVVGEVTPSRSLTERVG